MLYKLYVTYDTTIGSYDRPFKRQYDGYSHEVRHNHKLWIDSSGDDYHYPDQTIELPESDMIFVVYVLYTDGGTFGCTEGYFKCLCITTDIEEAKRHEKMVYDDTHPEKHTWTGYFTSRDSVNLVGIKPNERY